MNQYFPCKMVNFHNSARSIFTLKFAMLRKFSPLEGGNILLKGRRAPSLAWRLPRRRGEVRSCWGRQGAETEGCQRGAASGEQRRTSASLAQTPEAAWFLLAYSGTRSWPGSQSAWVERRTLPSPRCSSTASPWTSSPARSAAAWWMGSWACD